MLPVTVETNIQTTDTMNDLHTTALNLGSLAKNNKNLPDFDMFDDDVSQVTVATKNSAEGNSNAPNEILHNLSDSDDKQFGQIPNIPQNQRSPTKTKTKTKRNQHKEEGWQTSNG